MLISRSAQNSSIPFSIIFLPDCILLAQFFCDDKKYVELYVSFNNANFEMHIKLIVFHCNSILLVLASDWFVEICERISLRVE